MHESCSTKCTQAGRRKWRRSPRACSRIVRGRTGLWTDAPKLRNNLLEHRSPQRRRLDRRSKEGLQAHPPCPFDQLSPADVDMLECIQRVPNTLHLGTAAEATKCPHITRTSLSAALNRPSEFALTQARQLHLGALPTQSRPDSTGQLRSRCVANAPATEGPTLGPSVCGQV